MPPATPGDASDSENEPGANDQPFDVAPLRAERHPNADFCAHRWFAANAHYAVGADGGDSSATTPKRPSTTTRPCDESLIG
jgi:hypothetical protein